MSQPTKEHIEGELITINLKKRLYDIRNEILDYLVSHEPDEKVHTLLQEADSHIIQWRESFHDYLVTDDEYYSMVTHRILEPVTLVLYDRDGIFDDLEEKLEKSEDEREKLIEKIGRLKSNVEHYYGCFGGCRAWESEE